MKAINIQSQWLPNVIKHSIVARIQWSPHIRTYDIRIWSWRMLILQCWSGIYSAFSQEAFLMLPAWFLVVNSRGNNMSLQHRDDFAVRIAYIGIQRKVECCSTFWSSWVWISSGFQQNLHQLSISMLCSNMERIDMFPSKEPTKGTGSINSTEAMGIQKWLQVVCEFDPVATEAATPLGVSKFYLHCIQVVEIHWLWSSWIPIVFDDLHGVCFKKLSWTPQNAKLEAKEGINITSPEVACVWYTRDWNSTKTQVWHKRKEE